jgi:transcriptional regulator with XRE-family HTH domain
LVEGDLQSLGLLLKQARESQALTLEEVELRTRIRARFLQALESGDLSVLPTATHAKGFLRNYAQFLQLDANSIVAEFSSLTGSGSNPITTVTAALRPAFERQQRPALPPSTADWEEDSAGSAPDPSATQRIPATHITRGNRVGPSTPRGSVAPPPMYAPSPYEDPLEESHQQGKPGRFTQSPWFVVGVLGVGFLVIVWWATTQLSRVSVDDLIPTSEPSQFLVDFAASQTVAPSPTFEPTSTPIPEVGGVQILDRVLLKMEVKQRTWIRITVDGQIEFEGQAVPGSVLQYEGQTSVVVLAGNAAGLDINYNGQSIGLLGDRGEVVERFFTAGGQMISPTPTATVTPTNTSVPSPTPRLSPTP